VEDICLQCKSTEHRSNEYNSRQMLFSHLVATWKKTLVVDGVASFQVDLHCAKFENQ